MILSFFLNLAFRWEFLVAAAIALALHFIFDISIWFSVGILALWVIISLGITLVLAWANSSASEPTPEKKNLNPYSKKSEDYLKNNFNESEDS